MQCWSISVAGLVTMLVAASPVSAANVAVVPALCGSIDRNIAHAQNWLEAGDFKSLAQAAGGLELLAAVLQSQGDDETWREAAGRVAYAAMAVRSAAQSRKVERNP